MYLATSSNLSLMLYDAPNRIFSTNSQFFGQPKNDVKTLFSTLHHPSLVIFSPIFLQRQQWWHLSCLAILSSTSIVIHSVNQHLLRNWPGSDSCDLSRLLVQKIVKDVQSRKPVSLNCPVSSATHHLHCRLRETSGADLPLG